MSESGNNFDEGYGFASEIEAYDILVDGEKYMVYNTDTGWQEMSYRRRAISESIRSLVNYKFRFTMSIPGELYADLAEVTYNWIITKEEFRKVKLDHVLN